VGVQCGRNSQGLTARRDRDARNAVISGGRCPALLDTTCAGQSRVEVVSDYQRFADQGTTLELRALTVRQEYWVAIESFDENGVSALGPAIRIR